jgi:hypothetical protein
LGTTLTGLARCTTGARFTNGVSRTGLGLNGGTTRFTRGGNLGRGARGAKRILGANGAFGAFEKEEKDGTERTWDTLGARGTSGALLKQCARCSVSSNMKNRLR